MAALSQGADAQTATRATVQPVAPVFPATTTFLPSTSTAQPLALQRNDIRITPALDLTYDDNIFRTNPSVAPKENEFIVSPSVTAAVEHIFGPTQVAVGGTYGYDVYTQHHGRSRPRFLANGRATATVLGSCGVTPYADYRRERSDYGDINAAVDNTQRIAHEGALVSCQRSAGLFPSVSYEHFTTRNSNPFNYADQTTDTAIAGVGYRKPSFGQLLLYYRHDHTDRPTIDIRTLSDRVGATFDRAISSKIAASVDIHWLWVRSTSPQVSDYHGPGWRVEVSTRLIPRVRIAVSTSRSIVNDSLVTDGFALQSTYGVLAQTQLTSLTAISLGAEHRKRDFRQPAEQVRSRIGSDKTNILTAAITHRLSDRLRLRVEGTHSTRTTDTDRFEYHDNRALAGVELSF